MGFTSMPSAMLLSVALQAVWLKCVGCRCCNSFQNFLKAVRLSGPLHFYVLPAVQGDACSLTCPDLLQSCRCNPSSESLITAAGFNDDSFATGGPQAVLLML